MRHARPHVLLAALAVTACSADVTPTNPFDPETPAEGQARATIRGRVSAATLPSPAGLELVLRRNNAPVAQATAAADGSFLFGGVLPSSYTVVASPPGFVPVTLPVTVAAGEDLDLGEVPLAPLLGDDAARITGRAALQGMDFHGGTLVEAVGRAFTAVTGTDGDYRLVVTEGTYTLRFTHADFVTHTIEEVTVARGAAVALDPVVLAGNPATVSGEVRGERADGTWAPLADATVTLEGTGVTGLTSASGTFTLGGVPAGTYLLRAVKAGHDGAGTPVLALAGGEARTLDAPLALPLSRGALSGRVALAGATDASGAVVEVTGTGRAVVTGADGAFRLDGLVAGTYEVTARRDGWARRVRGGVAVAADAVADVGTLELARADGRVAVVEGDLVKDRAVGLRLDAPGAIGFLVSEDPELADPARGDVRGGPWRAYGGPSAPHPFTLSDADGAHAVHALFFDGENVTQPATAAVVLDRLAPAGTAVLEGGAAWTRNAVAALALAAEDLPASPGAAVSGLARMVLSPDPDVAGDAAMDFAPLVAWPLGAGEGPKDVWVAFEDRAGNRSAAVRATVVLDATGPASPSIALEGGAEAAAGTTGSPLVTARLAATDLAPAGALAMRLSNAPGFEGASWVPFAPEAAWMLPPGDGPKTVWAQFRDPAGNESLAVSATISLLSSPPSSGTLVVEGGAAATANPLAALAISAAGAADMRLFVNGVAATGWIPYATAATVDLGADPAEGTRTVSVSFRNLAGVEGGGATASIRFDRVAPAAGGLQLVGTLGNGSTSATLTATPVVVANVTPPGTDAASMALVQAATATTACATALASPPWQPVARSATVALAGTGGAKRVCVVFRDAAGNWSAASATAAEVTLDTTPPTNPAFVNVAAGTTNRSAAPAAGRPVVTPATDDGAGGVVYQCMGGEGSAYGPRWVDCGTSTTLPLAFALARNAETTVAVRARDAAHNASPGTFVRLVHDDVAPFPPFVTAIRSGRDAVTVSWDGTGDADVAQYLVHYGNAAGRLTGTGAAQGPSPVPAGAFAGTANPSFTLTGLTPGLAYYVAVEAVDAAGNRSGPSGERQAVPGKANPRVLSSFAGQARSLGVLASGSRTYAYLGVNQGLVQLDVTSDAAPPRVIGRVHLPDLVPDPRAAVAVMPCLRGATPGHCVIPAGTTLEGDFRDAPDAHRAAAPVVFFRLDGAWDAPSVGSVEGILPVRPHHVLVASIGGQPVVLTVDLDGVRAYQFKAGQLAFVREIARADFGTRMRGVLGATLAGSALHVYARPDGFVGFAPELFTFDVGGVTSGAVTRAAHGPLRTARGATLGDVTWPGSPEPVPALHGGVFVAYVDEDGSSVISSYAPGIDTPQMTVALCETCDGEGVEPVSTAGAGESVYVLLNPGMGLAESGWRIPFDGEDLLAPVPVPSSGDVSSAALAAPNHLGEERLYSVEVRASDGTSVVHRWAAGASAVTHLPSPFVEFAPTWFAQADRFVYVSEGPRIHTVETANPLAPAVIATFHNAGRLYRKLVAHGRFLYAITGAVVDVFRMSGDGTLSWRATRSFGTGVVDVAVAGRHAFVATSTAIQALDVGAIASNVWTLRSTWTAPGGTLVTALDARADSTAAALASWYPAIVYAAVTTGGTAQLQTLSFDGASLAALSTAFATGGDPASAVTVAGDHVALSGMGGTAVVTVSHPAFPSFGGTFHPVAGPALLQAGYVVGLATDGDPSGPPFAGRGTTVVDGAIRYSTCASDQGDGSLAHDGGLYVASCRRNGVTLFTPATLDGARLLKSSEVTGQWSGGAAFATDGMLAWLGGPVMGSGDASRLWYANESSTAEGAVTQPLWSGASLQNALAIPRAPGPMAHVDGVLWVTGSDSLTVTLDAYDPFSSPWTRVARLGLGGTGSHAPRALVSDGGGFLYLARTSSSGSTIEVIDVRSPASPLVRATVTTPGERILSLALARDRLYAGVAAGAGRVNDVLVWDVSSIAGGGTTLTSLPRVLGAAEGDVTGVAVSGRTLFFTFHDDWYGAMPDGLSVVRLSANRDGGTGAFTVATLPAGERLQGPVLAGDVLYAASNLGVAAYDLAPLWRDGAAPVRGGGMELADPVRTDAVKLHLEGPFGFLVGGTYRVFDLR